MGTGRVPPLEPSKTSRTVGTHSSLAIKDVGRDTNPRPSTGQKGLSVKSGKREKKNRKDTCKKLVRLGQSPERVGDLNFLLAGKTNLKGPKNPRFLFFFLSLFSFSF